ncbi:RNA polymerase B [Malassezia yamatoensis]|uniref:RNA polymerase B n=1 Tax=Malassezia yamatoensis TaxID=253288 RepID=A0AAJ5YQK4_9BASI|nr:RNA polymerase B [Malassezia yamatoensis]
MSVPAFQRRRRGHADVEDASQGKLGPGETTEGDSKGTAVAQKTKEYVDEFSRYREQSTIREVRALLIKHAAQPDLDGTINDSKSLQLSQFEMAQLANLTISDVDEARTLIPTLASKDEAQLESLLNELAAIRRFS